MSGRTSYVIIDKRLDYHKVILSEGYIFFHVYECLVSQGNSRASVGLQHMKHLPPKGELESRKLESGESRVC
jgi:hypothetical protein